MELNEEVKALQSENKYLKDMLEKTCAEKVAIDQMLVENLKSVLNSKMECILNAEKVKKLEVEISVLKNEKEVLEKELQNLKLSEVEKEIDEILESSSTTEL